MGGVLAVHRVERKDGSLMLLISIIVFSHLEAANRLSLGFLESAILQQEFKHIA